MPKTASPLSLPSALCTLFFLFCCTQADAAEPLKISVSLYPLSHLVEQIGGALVDVHTVIPAGAEPHEYEPTPKDIIGALKTKVFFYQGGAFTQEVAPTMEPWVNKLLPNLKKKNTTIVEMAPRIRDTDASALIAEGDRFNPHTWLDPTIYAMQAETVARALSAADPSNKAAYEKNKNQYIEKLKLLDDRYRQGFKTCATRDIVVSHDFFKYPARRYGFKTHPVRGLSTDEEASAGKLAELTRLINKFGIKFVFGEPLRRDKDIETLALETGAQTLTLNPFESPTNHSNTDDKSDKAHNADKADTGQMDYVSVMNENLANLKKALNCK